MPDHQQPGDAEKFCAGALLELAPEIVGAQEQRDVGRILKVGFANHAALAVRRPEIVAARELFQAKDGGAAPRAVGEDGTSHPAQTDDGHVIAHRGL